MTNTGGAIVAQSGHYPFGENWYETAANKLKFTTYERDNTPSEGGDDYAMLRSYINRFGRFSAPDLLAGRLPNPQTLNRYAYSLNNPINLSDPLGLSPCGDEPGMPPCPLLIEGGDPFGFGCTLDGISVGCGWVSRSTIYEVAVPCPNNICFGAAWDSRINTWVNVQFVAFAGGTSGYFRPSDLTSGVHEFNGRIYNTANWNILVQMTFAERIDAQRHATARAIAEQSGGKISEQDAYARLSVDGGFLRGGELQFCD
jgi:RHS repeat-associated protein